ncbi:MAG: enoyl-CoA hydratase-related protein [Acidobacteriota bacterium]
MPYRHLRVTRDGHVEHLLLDRPEVRNAFNGALVDDLAAWAAQVRQGDGSRVAVLAGAGSTFCAGADLGWMSAMVDYSRDENLRDAERMAGMFASLDHLPIPLIGRIHGAALGGGCGLAAVCDLVVADEAAVFGFTEVKLGILPAIISPYVLAKIGRSAAREFFLTGAKFSAARALEIGLIHAVVPAARLDEIVAGWVTQLLSSAPGAIAAAKELIGRVWGVTADDARALTADAIATQRVSDEGQEGMRAFLGKRRAAWRGDA